MRMVKEKSAGAVIFRREEGKIYYLLLHYHFKGEYWDFPRGKMEEGETEEQTAVREIGEETGISGIKFIPGFRETTSWFYRFEGENVSKEAVYFLAGTDVKDVVISNEHIEYLWLDYKDSMSTLTYANTKKILEAADKFLNANLERFLKDK